MLLDLGPAGVHTSPGQSGNSGGVPHKIPFNYVLEMICDWCGACRAYSGESEGIFEKEFEWWSGNRDKVKIHERTKKLITCILYSLSDLSKDFPNDPRRDELAMNRFISWGYIDSLKKEYETLL